MHTECSSVGLQRGSRCVLPDPPGPRLALACCRNVGPVALESARKHAMGRWMKRAFFVFVCVSTLALAGCGESGQQSTVQSAPPPTSPDEHPMLHAPVSIAEWAKGAQLFEGLGSTHRKITTASPEAQKYFEQGLRLLWAFNHDESTRSFARATELDPRCAICYWGVAFTVGPNYNMLMMAAPRASVAWEALQNAQRERLERGQNFLRAIGRVSVGGPELPSVYVHQRLGIERLNIKIVREPLRQVLHAVRVRDEQRRQIGRIERLIGRERQGKRGDESLLSRCCRRDHARST